MKPIAIAVLQLIVLGLICAGILALLALVAIIGFNAGIDIGAWLQNHNY